MSPDYSAACAIAFSAFLTLCLHATWADPGHQDQLESIPSEAAFTKPPATNIQSRVNECQASALELGMSIAFRPSIEWISKREGVLSLYYGIGASWMFSPFPIARSQGPDDLYTIEFLFYPEASAFLGARATLGGLLDAGLELHLGGDACLEVGRLELYQEGIDSEAFAWALTPLSWIEPSLRYNFGVLSGYAWLRHLSVEARLLVPVGDPLLVYERFRWEVSAVFRP